MDIQIWQNNSNQSTHMKKKKPFTKVKTKNKTEEHLNNNNGPNACSRAFNKTWKTGEDQGNQDESGA
jgi:hypothetical protein